MKAKKLLLLPLALAVASCGKVDEHTNKDENNNPGNGVTVMCPTGAPAVALSGCFDCDSFETTADPSLLPGYMTAGKYSIVVAPTDAGIKAIRNGADYKIAATITFGNFYLVSTGNDENNTVDADDSIVLFQKGALPDKIFHYVYGNAFDSNITYVKNVAVAATAYETKEVTAEEGTKIAADYVLLAEPKLTALNVTNTIYNLSTMFETKSETSKVYQASIFVKNSSSGGNYLPSIKTNIESMLKQGSTTIEDNMSKESDPATFFGMPTAMAKKITAKNNGMALGFEYSKDVKDSLNTYLEILNVQPLTDEEIYK